MKKYIQLCISIILLTLSKSSFSMEEQNDIQALEDEMDQSLSFKEHNQTLAIFQFPDELLLKIVDHALNFTKSTNIFEALESLKMHKLNVVCKKFRALMQDDTITKKQTLQKLLEYYKNLLRESFVIEVNDKLQLKNIQFHKPTDIMSQDLEETCHSAIVEFLLDSTSKLKKDTNRPIIANLLSLIAIDNEKLAIDCIKLLTFYGADINAGSINSTSPLHICTYRGWIEATKLLLNHPNIIVDKTCDYGKTALMDMCIVTIPNLAIVKLLLEKGANPNLKAYENSVSANNSCTPLIFAIKNDNSSIAKLLLSQPNIDVDISDEHRMSPLMWAAYLGNLEIVKLLLEKNANTKLVDYFGKTAKSRATTHFYTCNQVTKNHYDDIAQLIEKHESNLNS